MAMSYSYVSYATGDLGGSGQQTISCTVPTSAQAGDVLLAVIFRDSALSSQSDTAFYSIGSYDGTSGSGYVYTIQYKVLTSSDPGSSKSWTQSSPNPMSATFIVMRGIPSGFEAKFAGANVTGTTHSAPALTVSAGDTVVWRWYSAYNSGGNWSSSDGTRRVNHMPSGASDNRTVFEQRYSQGGSLPSHSATVVNSGATTLTVAFTKPNALPSAPTLGSPAAGAKISSGAASTFSWTHSDPDGDSQAGFAFRRRIGTGAYEYWNAGSGVWQTTQVVNTSSTQSVTFPTGVWANNTTYGWSVATSDYAGLGAYSTERNVVVENSASFAYTGAGQTYVVPVNVTKVVVEAWGAQGGSGVDTSSNPVPGGKGGYIKGTLSVTAGESLSIRVGGQPGSTTAVYGGTAGGSGGGNASAGGSSSDVYRSTTRLAVAAGGGGKGGNSTYSGGPGGDGGGTSGVKGAEGTTNTSLAQGANGAGGHGGTQTAGGAGGSGAGTYPDGAAGTSTSGGAGGDGSYADGGGGGGGYYGGGGGGAGGIVDGRGGGGGGGGGGSSYTGTLTDVMNSAGIREGHGVIVITAVTSPELTSPANLLPVTLSSGQTFQWTSSLAQSQYALYRRTWGSTTKEYWTGSGWSTTETWLATTTQSVTIGGAYWPSDDATYYWSVAVKDANGVVAPYASERVINPWEFWTGSAWSVTEVAPWATSATDNASVSETTFVSGSKYNWSVITKDSAGQTGAYSETRTFTLGGVVPREGWGGINI